MQNQSTRFRYECARANSLELFKYKISPGRGISFPRDFPFRNINDSFYTDTFSTLILQSISILENFLNVSRICQFSSKRNVQRCPRFHTQLHVVAYYLNFIIQSTCVSLHNLCMYTLVSLFCLIFIHQLFLIPNDLINVSFIIQFISINLCNSLKCHIIYLLLYENMFAQQMTY